MKLLTIALFIIQGTALANSNDRSEIHFTLCSKKQEIQNAFEGQLVLDKSRKVYYFDSENQSLYNNGLIIRLRKGKKKSNITLKIKGLRENQFDHTPFKDGETKCELDIYGDFHRRSCSHKQKISNHLIDQVINGQKSIASILTREQILMIQLYYKKKINWNNIRLFGSVFNQKYELILNRFPYKIDFEIFQYPDQRHLMEFSYRTIFSDYKTSYNSLKKIILEKNIKVCERPVSKTKFTLDYFSK